MKKRKFYFSQIPKRQGVDYFWFQRARDADVKFKALPRSLRKYYRLKVRTMDLIGIEKIHLNTIYGSPAQLSGIGEPAEVHLSRVRQLQHELRSGLAIHKGAQ